MKKSFLIYTLALCLLSTPVHAAASSISIDAKQGIPYQYTPPEGSIDELYKDIIVTLIEPYITEAIAKQYGQALSFDLFGVEFLEIHRPTYRGFTFLIKLQVKPFVGAHNTIGIDELVIQVSPLEDDPKVLSFEHIKSFPLPPHLKDSYSHLKL